MILAYGSSLGCLGLFLGEGAIDFKLEVRWNMSLTDRIKLVSYRVGSGDWGFRLSLS